MESTTPGTGMPAGDTGGEAQEDLLALVAQEMRGPLTAVKGYTQRLLMSWDGLDDRGKLSLLGRINTSVSRLHRLVDDITLLAGGTGRGVTLLPRPFLLEQVVHYALAEVGARYGDRATAIMPAGENVSMYGDQYRLEQVLITLLELAVLRAPRETPIEVFYEATSDTERVRLSIADAGAPLSAAEWEALLGQSGFAVTGTSVWGAMALNLLIARRVVGAMGGTLSGVSGSGSNHVTLEVPVTQPTPARGEV